jgi:hypothetical protein
LLIGPLSIELNASTPQFCAGWNDFRIDVGLQVGMQALKNSAPTRCGKAVGQLGQHPSGGKQADGTISGKTRSAGVSIVGGIQKRQKVKRICKDTLHFFGPPWM